MRGMERAQGDPFNKRNRILNNAEIKRVGRRKFLRLSALSGGIGWFIFKKLDINNPVDREIPKTDSLENSEKLAADLKLLWDQEIIPLSRKDVGQKLRDGDPRILYDGAGPRTLQLEAGEEVIVARRLRELFITGN